MAIIASGAGEVLSALFEALSAGTPPSQAELSALLTGLDTGPEVLSGLAFLTEPGLSPAGESFLLGSVLLITEECGGDLSTLSGDLAVWQGDPKLSTVLSLADECEAALVASGIDPALAAALSSFAGVIP